MRSCDATPRSSLPRRTTPPCATRPLELRRRIEPDPLAKYLLFVSVLLLVFLVVWAYRMQAR